MLKLLGSILVVGSLSRIGWEMARSLRRRTALLRRLIGALERMEREVQTRLTPLPALCDLLSQEVPSPLNRFFSQCGKDREEGFAKTWRTSAEGLRGSLSNGTVDCLARLGSSLGRSDREGEQALLSSTVEELRGLLAQEEENSLRQGRLFGILGVTAGFFCVILLI